MKAKQIKITGEIILVLSFVTQSLLFDYYNDKLISLRNGDIAQSLIDKGSELKEIKYFVAKDPLDSTSQQEYQKLNIEQAARKIALAKTVQITGLDTTEKAKVDMSNQLIQASFKVHDFESYMNFVQIVNNQYVGDKVIITQIEKLQGRKQFFRWVFWSLYIVGSLFLISAIAKEKN